MAKAMHKSPTATDKPENLTCDYSGHTTCPAMDALTRTVGEIVEAFPAGDMRGHRLYHEELIATMKARREFWQKLTFELVKWGLIGFIGWTAIQLWHAFLKGPK